MSAIPFFNDAVTGTVVDLKAGAGEISSLDLLNTTAATAYLQIFNVPAANVTLGTTTAAHWIRLTANQSKTLIFPEPLKLSGTGISIAGTTTKGGSTGAAISVGGAYV
jgi:hypothetical protein